MDTTKSHGAAAQPSTPVVSWFLLSSSLCPHQILSSSLSKQMRSDEPGVPEVRHTARTALATDARELKGSESAGC